MKKIFGTIITFVVLVFVSCASVGGSSSPQYYEYAKKLSNSPSWSETVDLESLVYGYIVPGLPDVTKEIIIERYITIGEAELLSGSRWNTRNSFESFYENELQNASLQAELSRVRSEYDLSKRASAKLKMIIPPDSIVFEMKEIRKLKKNKDTDLFNTTIQLVDFTFPETTRYEIVLSDDAYTKKQTAQMLEKSPVGKLSVLPKEKGRLYFYDSTAAALFKLKTYTIVYSASELKQAFQFDSDCLVRVISNKPITSLGNDKYSWEGIEFYASKKVIPGGKFSLTSALYLTTENANIKLECNDFPSYLTQTDIERSFLGW